MNIIVRTSDSIVVYAGEGVELSDDGAVSQSASLDPSTTFANAMLYQVGSLPADWIGGAYTYDGSFHLVNPDLIPKPPIPQEVPKKYGKLALIMTSHWDALMAYVDGLSEPMKTVALVQINDSEVYRRDDDFLREAATELGMTDADLDALFVLGDSLAREAA